MREVVLFSGDARLEEALRPAQVKTVRLDPSALAGFDRGAPAALVVDVRGQHQLPIGLAAFCARHADTAIVLVASALEPQLMLEAMRVGVNEYVSEPVTTQALQEAVQRALSKGVADQVGQVFAFVGAKGGVGTTTLAVNTATTLACSARRPVLLLDLHLGHGDAAVFLGVEPKFSVIDAMENVHRLDETYLRSLVQKTKAGVELLGPSERLTAGGVDGERMHQLLDFASRQYPYTVLDVPRSDVAMLDVLETAAAILLVSSHELSSLQSAGRLARILRTRYSRSSVQVVINRFDRKSEITQKDIEHVVGDSVKYLLPSDYRSAHEALARGRPIVLDHNRLGHAFRSLAKDLGGLTKRPAEKSTGGLLGLGRLAHRRA